MTTIRNLFFLLVVTVFALASTILSLFNYNPYEVNFTGFINFYISLFILVTGVLGLIIYYTKNRRVKTESIRKVLWPSVRQAGFISLAIVGLLLLRGMKILDWLIGISLIIVIILLELFFQTKKLRPVK